ncbi:MAG: tautomerase family protein [Dehalococcoidales bacterium]|nr:tautomerase family protein [Dehalococcoidales bacterium]
MPHVIIKMHPGRTAEQKSELVTAIVKSVTEIVKCEEKSVSVAIEEVSPEDWAEKVYKPDILQKEKTLLKKPGYNPFKP